MRVTSGAGLIFNSFCLLVATVFFISSLGYDTDTGLFVRMFAVVAMCGFAFLTAKEGLQLRRRSRQSKNDRQPETRSRHDQPDRDPAPHSDKAEKTVQVGVVFLWFVMFIAASFFIGLLPALVLFLVAFLLWSKTPVIIAILFAAIIPGALYVLFTWGLQRYFYPGILFGGIPPLLF